MKTLALLSASLLMGLTLTVKAAPISEDNDFAKIMSTILENFKEVQKTGYPKLRMKPIDPFQLNPEDGITIKNDSIPLNLHIDFQNVVLTGYSDYSIDNIKVRGAPYTNNRFFATANITVNSPWYVGEMDAVDKITNTSYKGDFLISFAKFMRIVEFELKVLPDGSYAFQTYGETYDLAGYNSEQSGSEIKLHGLPEDISAHIENNKDHYIRDWTMPIRTTYFYPFESKLMFAFLRDNGYPVALNN